MTVASIGIRVYKREKLWAFRISSGGFITPHYVFSTLLFSVFFIVRTSACRFRRFGADNNLAVELFCLQSMRKYGYIDNQDRRDALLWRSTRFLPRRYFVLTESNRFLIVLFSLARWDDATLGDDSGADSQSEQTADVQPVRLGSISSPRQYPLPLHSDALHHSRLHSDWNR